MQAWIKVMLNCMFTILFTSMVLGVCFYLFTVMPALQAITSMVVSMLGQTGGTGLGSMITGAMNDPARADGVWEMFLLSIWLCIFFLKQVPGYAAAITGITVNSAYELGHSIEHAGFAAKGKGDKSKPIEHNPNKPR